MGFEFTYKIPSTHPLNTCLLTDYVKEGPVTGQYTCYRYGADCPYRPTVPVKNQWNDDKVCPSDKK